MLYVVKTKNFEAERETKEAVIQLLKELDDKGFEIKVFERTYNASRSKVVSDDELPIELFKMKKLVDYFKKTAYGEDTRSLSSNLKKWFLDRGIKASVKKTSLGLVNVGNRVFKEYRNRMKIEILVQERFNLEVFSAEFIECTFQCVVPEKIFPQSYLIEICINGVSLFDCDGMLQLGTKFREGICTENMIWLRALNGISFADSYQKETL